MSNVRKCLLGLLVTFSIGCSATGEKADRKTVEPRPDQVSFFERPRTLAAVRNSGSPRPLVVLLESDPWALVIGSDSPRFALYADGTFIQRDAVGFRTGRLSSTELETLVATLKLGALSEMSGRYEAEHATDQPEVDLLIYTGEMPIFVSVYGSLKHGEVRDKVPEAIVSAYDKMLAFNHPSTMLWLPAEVEVIIWPYEYAPDASIKWPSEWPGLSDPKTIKRGDDSFSIFMPSAKLYEIQAFLKQRSARGAVEIDGRKWSASIRYPFPHENLWMAPYPELERAKR